MKTVTLLKGIPASGKSTYAKQLVADHPNMYKRINRDSLREMFDGYHVSKGNEKFLKKVRDMLIIAALEDGKHVIIDDMNLSPKNETRTRQMVEQYNKSHNDNVEVHIKEFKIDLVTAIELDKKRERKVGAKFIRKMHQQFYSKNARYAKQDAALPKAILCDLDGTLAIMNGRSPYDGSACETDLLNEPIADLLKLKRANGTKIFLFSGRNGEFKPETIRWLDKFNIEYDLLIMRAQEDSRRDSIVKQEMFDEHVKDQYFVEFVLDDRDQVVDLWRDTLGLPCFQVYYGDF